MISASLEKRAVLRIAPSFNVVLATISVTASVIRCQSEYVHRFLGSIEADLVGLATNVHLMLAFL